MEEDITVGVDSSRCGRMGCGRAVPCRGIFFFFGLHLFVWCWVVRSVLRCPNGLAFSFGVVGSHPFTFCWAVRSVFRSQVVLICRWVVTSEGCPSVNWLLGCRISKSKRVIGSLGFKISCSNPVLCSWFISVGT